MKCLNKILGWLARLKTSVKAYMLILLALIVWYLLALPSPLFDTPYSTVVADRNGELLGARIAGDGQWRFPPTDAVHEKYRVCLIEFEDRWFDYHPGVNPFSIGRALVQNIKNRSIVSGGSTITMQTIRLARHSKRTYFEKIVEVILSTRLELTHSKQDIIALYASHAPMGGNVVGIDAASWRYFGHDAKSLSWAEAATLAVLPNSPSVMHFGRNRDKLIAKRNSLLLRLHKKQTIDKLSYELAISEPLPEYPNPLPQIAPHLVTQLYLHKPGYYINSTIDKHLQMQSEGVLDRWNYEFSQNGINNIAAIIVDVKTNEIISYNGNVNFASNLHGGQVDVVQSRRSSGSILKPFLYCAMLQEGALLPGELVPDVPININGFSPKNFSLNYDGAVHADEALARSLNIPFVVMLRKYGIEKFHGYLKDIGLSTINRSPKDYGLSMILGGAEATLIDVSRAYADLAHAVSVGHDKSLVGCEFRINKDDVSNKPKYNYELDAAAAWLTLQALANVNRPEEIDMHSVPSIRRVAWKTGTSYGFRDAWAIGVTPDYLVAVWTGNASGEGRPGLTGARTSANVMFDLFNLLPVTSWFDTPFECLTEVKICRESGCTAGINCPETVVDTLLVPFKARQGSTCEYHRIVHLSADGQYRVYENCSQERGIVTESRFVLPPSWEWFYKQHHADYRQLPPFSPECVSGDEEIMQFIYPYPNSVIKLTKQLDGSMGKTVFELAHQNSSAKIFWHLDDEYLGETTDIHQLEMSPQPGEHIVTVVDNLGNSSRIKFQVE